MSFQSPKHHVPFSLKSICCLLPFSSFGGLGRREHYSPIISLYDFTLKSARCCDENSKINIYSNKRYISTRSNCFYNFHIFWPTPLVRNTNLKGLVYSNFFLTPLKKIGSLSRCLPWALGLVPCLREAQY